MIHFCGFVAKHGDFDKHGVFLGRWIQSQTEDSVATRANQEQILYRAPTRTPTWAARQKSSSLFRCFGSELSLLFLRRACQQLLVTHLKTAQGRRPQKPSSLQSFINIYLFFCTLVLWYFVAHLLCEVLTADRTWFSLILLSFLYVWQVKRLIQRYFFNSLIEL